MPQVRSHRDLVVWQKAIELVVGVYTLSRHFPEEERFGLTSQIRRAAVSVALNIAEGHGRTTRGEFLNQLSSGRGSLMEVFTVLVLARRLGFAPDATLTALESLADEVSRMLYALMKRLGARLQRQPTGHPHHKDARER